jgi:hypothetical protein
MFKECCGPYDTDRRAASESLPVIEEVGCPGWSVTTRYNVLSALEGAARPISSE